jgi:hypothetical protein
VVRPNSVLALALVTMLAASCSREPGRESAAVSSSGPPHGGRAIDLSATDRAELVVDDTGMIVVRLYDASWRLLDPAGKSVTVRIETPDSAFIDLQAEPMGTGSAGHFMVPMDKAVIAHVQESGGYAATVQAVIDGRHVQGTAKVQGLATGGQGM